MTVTEVDVLTMPLVTVDIGGSVATVTVDRGPVTTVLVQPPKSVGASTSLPGTRGVPGLSAYEIWLGEGNEGSEQDFLDSLVTTAAGQRFVQGAPSAVWTIDHTLPFSPNVTTVDSSGQAVQGSVQYFTNRVVVTFSAPFSGEAYLS